MYAPYGQLGKLRNYSSHSLSVQHSSLRARSGHLTVSIGHRVGSDGIKVSNAGQSYRWISCLQIPLCAARNRGEMLQRWDSFHSLRWRTALLTVSKADLLKPASNGQKISDFELWFTPRATYLFCNQGACAANLDQKINQIVHKSSQSPSLRLSGIRYRSPKVGFGREFNNMLTSFRARPVAERKGAVPSALY